MGRVVRRYQVKREQDYEVILRGPIWERWNVVARDPHEAAHKARSGDGDHREMEWDGRQTAEVQVKDIWLRVLSDGFEFTIGPYDYHLRREDEPPLFPAEPWFLDIFLAEERDANRAHLNSETFATLEDAIEYAQDFAEEPSHR